MLPQRITLSITSMLSRPSPSQPLSSPRTHLSTRSRNHNHVYIHTPSLSTHNTLIQILHSSFQTGGRRYIQPIISPITEDNRPIHPSTQNKLSRILLSSPISCYLLRIHSEQNRAERRTQYQQYLRHAAREIA